MERQKLKGSLRTGHHANIFCTRYMPGTGVPHISSPARHAECVVWAPGKLHPVIDMLGPLNCRDSEMRVPHNMCMAK